MICFSPERFPTAQEVHHPSCHLGAMVQARPGQAPAAPCCSHAHRRPQWGRQRGTAGCRDLSSASRNRGPSETDRRSSVLCAHIVSPTSGQQRSQTSLCPFWKNKTQKEGLKSFTMWVGFMVGLERADSAPRCLSQGDP